MKFREVGLRLRSVAVGPLVWLLSALSLNGGAIAQPQPGAPAAPAASAPTLPPAASMPSAPAAAADAPALTVQVRAFDVLGNTLLPQSVLDACLLPYTGQTTLPRLREAAAAVQALYRQAGYGGVVAFLPRQESADGVVRIRVVEGKLTRIDISGNKHFSQDNIRASLPTLQIGQTPDVRRIDAQIQMANESPAKAVQVLLQPGADPGSVAARVTVAEQPVQRWTVRSDNSGSDRTGRWRAALGWQNADAFGLDHVFNAELQTSPQKPSTVRVFSGAYRAPWYAQALAFDAYGAWSDVDGGKTGTAAGDLQFNGRGFVLGARLQAYLPRLGNIDQRANVGLEARDYRNACSIDGLPQDACGSAGASVALLPLSLGYTVQAASDVSWGANVSLTTNLGRGGDRGSAAAFDAVRSGSAPHYTVLRVAGSLALPPWDFGSLSLRASSQTSAKALVPGEQFGIGGAQNVRGYEERELNGDWGAQVTAEFTGPSVAESWLGLQQADLRGLLFADAGWVGNRQSDACQPGRTACRLGALGVGVRGALRQAQLRLDVAHAMATAVRTRRGDNRLHAAVTVNF